MTTPSFPRKRESVPTVSGFLRGCVTARGSSCRRRRGSRCGAQPPGPSLTSPSPLQGEGRGGGSRRRARCPLHPPPGLPPIQGGGAQTAHPTKPPSFPRKRESVPTVSGFPQGRVTARGSSCRRRRGSRCGARPPARSLLLPPLCRGRVGVGVAGGGRRVRSTPLPASPLSRGEEHKRPAPQASVIPADRPAIRANDSPVIPANDNPVIPAKAGICSNSLRFPSGPRYGTGTIFPKTSRVAVRRAASRPVPYFSLPLQGEGRGGGSRRRAPCPLHPPLPASPLSRGEEHKRPPHQAPVIPADRPAIRANDSPVIPANDNPVIPAKAGICSNSLRLPSGPRYGTRIILPKTSRVSVRRAASRPVPHFSLPLAGGGSGLGVAGGGRRVRSTPLPASPLSRGEEHKRPTPPTPRHSLE